MPKVVETASLGPPGNVDDALQALWDSSDKCVAVIAGEPIVGLLAARLIGAHDPFIFKKAAGCRIDIEPGNRCGRLRWFLPPKILRETGRWA